MLIGFLSHTSDEIPEIVNLYSLAVPNPAVKARIRNAYSLLLTLEIQD